MPPRYVKLGTRRETEFSYISKVRQVHSVRSVRLVPHWTCPGRVAFKTLWVVSGLVHFRDLVVRCRYHSSSTQRVSTTLPVQRHLENRRSVTSFSGGSTKSSGHSAQECDSDVSGPLWETTAPRKADGAWIGWLTKELVFIEPYGPTRIRRDSSAQ
jgi:hypothetical protein